jgi:hypothetical protein
MDSQHVKRQDSDLNTEWGDTLGKYLAGFTKIAAVLVTTPKKQEWR